MGVCGESNPHKRQWLWENWRMEPMKPETKYVDIRIVLFGEWNEWGPGTVAPDDIDLAAQGLWRWEYENGTGTEPRDEWWPDQVENPDRYREMASAALYALLPAAG